MTRRTLRSLRVWRALLALAMLAVLVMSLMPPSPEMPTTGWDKSNHALGFAVLAWLGCQAFPRQMAVVLAGLLAYGALIEVLQSFTPDRMAEWADLGADGIGLLLGAAVHAAAAWCRMRWAQRAA